MFFQAGKTAEPPVKQGTTDDEGEVVTAALVAQLSMFCNGAVKKAIQSWEGLHWQYQQCMTDQLGRHYPDWISCQMENQPEDLRASKVHEMLSWPHLLLCSQTFKRD